MKRNHYIYASAMALVMTMPASVALAQEGAPAISPEAAPSPRKVDDGATEVIVTAMRRQSTVKEVPFSMAAFTGESLKAQQIFNPSALVQQVPGITLNTSDKSLSIVSIRGNTSTFRTATLDTPVAFFVDDVYYVFNNDLNSNFYDTSRVEVLRGPQGTLFGRNVVGGALAVVTNNPSFGDDFALSVTAGNGGYLRTEGMVNGVLVDGKLAGRMAFSTEHSDGLIDTPNQKGNFGALDSTSGRGKLLYTPNSSLKIVLGGDYSKSSGNGGAVALGVGGPQNIPATFGNFTNAKWTNNDYAAAPYNQKLRGVYVRADQDLFGGVLTSITGYRLNNSYSYLDNVPVGTVVPTFGLEQTVRNRSFTQEVRFASAPNRFSYVVGVYYLKAEVSTINSLYYSPLPGSPIGGAIPPNPHITNIVRTQNGDVESVAAFGEATFEITPKLSVIAGGRYTRDTKAIDYRAESPTNGNTPIPVFAFPGTVTASGSHSWEAFTPRFSIKYKPNEHINLYATYAKGFKSGGFVDNAYNNPTIPLNPENAVNKEVGVKTQFLNKRLTFNVSLFEQETQNLQNFSGAGGIAHTYNGTALSKGGEVETMWKISNSFRVNLNYTHIDGTYTSLHDPLVLADYSGNPVKYTPKDAMSLAGTYTHHLANGALITAQSDLSLSSKVHTDDANTLPNYPNLYNDTAGETLNARLTYDSPDGRWSFGLWGKNLTNHYQIVVADDINSFLAPSGPTRFWKLFTNNPRTFGVTLSFKN